MIPSTLPLAGIGAWLTLVLGAASASAGVLPTRLEGIDLVSGARITRSLSEAPRATVIAFVSSKCPCSSSHELELKRLAAENASRGIRFIGIHSNQDESEEAARGHFRVSDLGFPILHDAGATIADALGALKTPHVYVVSPSGEILYQGGVDDSHIQQQAKEHYLSNALNAILQGKTPEMSRTRTLGCVISRSPQS